MRLRVVLACELFACSAHLQGGADAGGDAGVDAGASVACATLAGSWSGGDAVQRGDGSFDVSSCQLTSPGTFEVVKPARREPARFASARCNDGTPFGFFVRLAPHPSSVWVIYLQGGRMCEDYAFSCAQREPVLTTTPPFGDATLQSLPIAGVLGSDPTLNPDFYDQNQVIAHYCSSDIWAGATVERRPNSGNPVQGWYFSGHSNVAALLGILAERYGLDDRNDALQVVFGGGSAGAFGAQLNASRVVAALPRAAAAGRVKLFVDAGWTVDWDDPAHRMGSATTSDRDVFTRALQFWGASFDPDCVAAQTTPATCMFGPTWYPFVAARQPVLIQQSSFDASFTSSHNLSATDASAQSWRDQVTASFVDISWLFSGSVSYHTLATTDGGLSMGPNGSTLRDVLGRFFRDGSAERVTF